MKLFHTDMICNKAVIQYSKIYFVHATPIFLSKQVACVKVWNKFHSWNLPSPPPRPPLLPPPSKIVREWKLCWWWPLNINFFFLGFTTDGEFNSLRTLGKARPISIIDVIRSARNEARRMSANTLASYFHLDRHGKCFLLSGSKLVLACLHGLNLDHEC